MFFKILIPALVKLMISFKDDMSKKVIFFNFCYFSNRKSILFEMSAATKKKEFWRRCFRNCTFYLGEGHFFADDTKREKSRKREKKSKKVSKRHKIQDGPQSGTKQSIWRGYPTGRERGDVGLESKTDPKRRFRSSKIDEKPCRILRILLFSSSGFSDRLWQNDRFCCMICTSFWKESRSKEALEEPLQCRMCSLT